MDSAQAENKEHTSSRDAQQIAELRELIFGLEYQQLLAVKARVADKQLRTVDIAEVLPQAVKRCADESGELSSELSTIVEQAIQASARRNPQPLVDAIFPVLGPAIRKAIHAAMDSMLATINATIEQGMSPRFYKWRFNAWRAGLTYSEYVIRRSMLYQVEQVFLIHKETGVLLHYVQSNDALNKDPDMVSGMLTAVQDFMRDSFKVEESSNLEMLSFGDMTATLEVGPRAVIAFIVRGNPPPSLRALQVETLEKFHLDYAPMLESFHGDVEPYKSTEEMLQSCLVNEKKEHENEEKAPASMWRAWVAIGIVLILLFYWQFTRYVNNQHWEAALNSLAAEPGLVVLNSHREDGQHVITGMKDPQAREPQTVIAESAPMLDPVKLVFTPFMSLDPSMIMVRATQLLNPPPSVSLAYDEGRLRLLGTAEKAWIEKVTNGPFNLVGVESIDVSELILDLTEVNKEIEALNREITNFTLYFESGESDLNDVQQERITALASHIKAHAEKIALTGSAAQYAIKGHSDLTGGEALRRAISDARASSVYDQLLQAGVDSALVSFIGAGAREYNADLLNNRRVTLSVELHDLTSTQHNNRISQ